jgi:hypothetical protein
VGETDGGETEGGETEGGEAEAEATRRMCRGGGGSFLSPDNFPALPPPPAGTAPPRPAAPMSSANAANGSQPPAPGAASTNTNATQTPAPQPPGQGQNPNANPGQAVGTQTLPSTNWQGPYQHVDRRNPVHNRDPTSRAPRYRRLWGPYKDLGWDQWECRPTYTEPPHTRRTFRLGEVISRPFHEANMSSSQLRPHQFDDYKDYVKNPITETRLHNCHKLNGAPLSSHVFSKRRMFVIIHKYDTTLFCLPLYT